MNRHQESLHVAKANKCEGHCGVLGARVTGPCIDLGSLFRIPVWFENVQREGLNMWTYLKLCV